MVVRDENLDLNGERDNISVLQKKEISPKGLVSLRKHLEESLRQLNSSLY
jgi:hypothetical protein